MQAHLANSGEVRLGAKVAASETRASRRGPRAAAASKTATSSAAEAVMVLGGTAARSRSARTDANCKQALIIT